jgi:hypothetical protein
MCSFDDLGASGCLDGFLGVLLLLLLRTSMCVQACVCKSGQQREAEGPFEGWHTDTGNAEQHH